MSAPPPATAEEGVVTDADTSEEAEAVGPARRWRPGATTGVVAAGAKTGAAAAGGGLPGWHVGFAVAVFAILAAVQLRRALAASRDRCDAGGRTRFVLRQMAPGLLAGAVTFAAVQLLVVPWLGAPPVPAGPTLP